MVLTQSEAHCIHCIRKPWKPAPFRGKVSLKVTVVGESTLSRKNIRMIRNMKVSVYLSTVTTGALPFQKQEYVQIERYSFKHHTTPMSA